jgi:hypothetical protein
MEMRVPHKSRFMPMLTSRIKGMKGNEIAKLPAVVGDKIDQGSRSIP